MFEERQKFALPLEIRGTIDVGPMDKIDIFNDALRIIRPDLTDRELEKIDGHFLELLDRIAQKNGHLPQDFISVRGRRGEMTHVLNGRLLRKDGIWIGLRFAEDPLAIPIEIISINRGNADQLHSLLGPIKAIGRRIEVRRAKAQG